MTDQERYDELSAQLDALYKSCANEYAKYVDSPKYDMYSERAYKKTKNIAQKYAKYIAPIQDELNEVADKINKEAEEERKKQFVTPAEAEKMEEIARRKARNKKNDTMI